MGTIVMLHYILQVYSFRYRDPTLVQNEFEFRRSQGPEEEDDVP